VNTLFIITGAVALVSALMTVTRSNAIHALLYTVVSLLSVGMIFYILGAPFAAALEVIIYAGAIMVLFVFVIMMLNINQSRSEEKQWIKPSAWTGPAILTLILAAEFVYAMRPLTAGAFPVRMISPVEVGISLFGPYLLGVELASMLLLAGLVGAYHLARHIGPAGAGEGDGS
jgi:NADH-quinone oxidoreductase subunit J